MKPHNSFIVLIGLFLIIITNSVQAQDSTKTEKKEPTTTQVQHFIDEDGDGYNDNAPDHDGDGIPNGLDPDWQKFQEQKRKQKRFVDLDGDGINDNVQEDARPRKGEGQNLHELKEGSSLENKSKEQQQKQQKKQRGKP
jgi:hypothetical protein